MGPAFWQESCLMKDSLSASEVAYHCRTASLVQGKRIVVSMIPDKDACDRIRTDNALQFYYNQKSFTIYSVVLVLD